MRFDDASEMFERARQMIEGASSIAVSGHTDPDGDALGSALAMTLLIEQIWPGKTVTPLLANDRPVPANLAFLPAAERLCPAQGSSCSPDLFISVDTPTRARLADSGQVLSRAGACVSFDHHPAVEDSFDCAYTNPSAASCADVVLDFADYLGAQLSCDIATCLLAGIITDTGRFQYQNTDPHALESASRLVQVGADPSDICLHVYQSKTMAQLKLQQVTLDRLALACNDELAYSYVLQSDFARFGASASDCDELVDNVRSLGGIKGVLFLRELPEGGFRGNLRSKDASRDVSLVAHRLGGGGHKMASGFSIAGTAQEAVARVCEIYADLYLDVEGGVR